MNQPLHYNKLYNIGLTLEQAAQKAGVTIVNPERERGCWSSLWVNGRLVRCYVKVNQ